jgi:hypothetical protein
MAQYFRHASSGEGGINVLDGLSPEMGSQRLKLVKGAFADNWLIV